MDEILEKVVKEISDNHYKIIDDWCKAYIAQIYQETGDIVKPGDFVLNEQVPTFHTGQNCMVRRYWFELKENTDIPSYKEYVNHPTHYKGNNLEAIDVIEDFNLNFNLGNCLKYVLRSGKKSNSIEDLNKAIWYLQREIDNLEKGTLDK